MTLLFEHSFHLYTLCCWRVRALTLFQVVCVEIAYPVITKEREAGSDRIGVGNLPIWRLLKGGGRIMTRLKGTWARIAVTPSTLLWHISLFSGFGGRLDVWHPIRLHHAPNRGAVGQGLKLLNHLVSCQSKPKGVTNCGLNSQETWFRSRSRLAESKSGSE